MPVEIRNKTEDSILVKDMKDGQIALFGVHIVQRFGKHLINIGMDSECSWEDADLIEWGVQVLKNGTKLTITDNE